jgi:hypothetical protein
VRLASQNVVTANDTNLRAEFQSGTASVDAIIISVADNYYAFAICKALHVSAPLPFPKPRK